jgi:hypothetical protein
MLTSGCVDGSCTSVSEGPRGRWQISRMRRVKKRVYAAAAAALLGAGVVVVLGTAGGGGRTASPSLPRRIGAPAVDSGHSPIGSASVSFSSSQWQMDGTIDTIALTGATDDTYRRLSNAYESTAGLTAILSPDGHRLAVINGIYNLSTNAVTALPPTGGSYQIPQAWSADGRYLATVSYSDWWAPAAYGSPSDSGELDVVDTLTGATTHITPVDVWLPIDGWIAAFASDGRLAYQSGDQITVVNRAGAVLARIAVPDGTRIAGKGAWTPDGRGIAVVAQGPCGCGKAYDSRWTLTTLDTSTGAAAGPAYHLDGVVAVRMLGWSPSDRPVVVAYDPVAPKNLDPGATPVSFRGPNRLSGLEDLDDVKAARVLALRLDGGSQLLSDAFGAESVDVADDVIAGGVSRAGDPPLLTESHLIEAVLAMLVLLVLLIGALVIRAVGRRQHRWREALRPATAA